MDYIMIAIVSFIAGWYVREWHATIKMNQFINKVERNTLEKLEEIRRNVIKIKIEKHEQRFFVYALEDNEFMAQGDSRKELEENLRKRYPGRTFAAEEDNLKEVGFSHESF